MALFDQANRLLWPADNPVFLDQRKGGFHLIKHIALVVFEGQSVIAILLDHLSRTLGLGSHGINRDNAACQRQLP